MIYYRITTLFIPEWPTVFTSVFGAEAVCYASLTEGNVAHYAFETQQNPKNLGPLVVIDTVATPPEHFPQA